MRKQKFKARDKTVEKMNRGGLVRENLHSKETVRVGRREADSRAGSVQGTEPVNLQNLHIHRADQEQKHRKHRRSYGQNSGYQINKDVFPNGQEKKMDCGSSPDMFEPEGEKGGCPDADGQEYSSQSGLECVADAYQTVSQAPAVENDSEDVHGGKGRFSERSSRMEVVRSSGYSASRRISGKPSLEQKKQQAQKGSKKKPYKSVSEKPPVWGDPDKAPEPVGKLTEHSSRMENVRLSGSPAYRKASGSSARKQKLPQRPKEISEASHGTGSSVDLTGENVRKGGNGEKNGSRRGPEAEEQIRDALDKKCLPDNSRLSFEDEYNGMARGAGAGIKRKAVSAVFGSARAYMKIEGQEEEDHSAVENFDKTGRIAVYGLLYSVYRSKRSRRKSFSRFSQKERDTQGKGRLRFEETRESGKETAKQAGGTTQAERKAMRKSWQKKQYQKAYRMEKRSIQSAMEASKAVQTIAGKAKHTVAGLVKSSSLLPIVAAIILLFVSVSSGLSVCGVMLPAASSIIIGTTYPSTDEDIYAVETYYLALENALNRQINNMESTHPGYDEYRYQVDEISHNPYHLISYLTTVYQEFTYEQVKDALRELFSAQYQLRIKEIVETRTRTDSHGNEEEYDYYILCISLTNRGFDTVAKSFLTAEQAELYAVYNITYGNRNYLFDTESIPGADDVGGAGFDIPGEALSDQKFANMIREAEKYLGYPYVWGGDSPSTGFDCSGFVSWVINNCGNGWNVGRQTAEGLRNCCAYISPADAKPGDLIFFQGTYNTSGASHVGIYAGSNMMIHCGNPIQYTNINSPYWKQHFLAFGRIQ